MDFQFVRQFFFSLFLDSLDLQCGFSSRLRVLFVSDVVPRMFGLDGERGWIVLVFVFPVFSRRLFRQGCCWFSWMDDWQGLDVLFVRLCRWVYLPFFVLFLFLLCFACSLGFGHSVLLSLCALCCGFWVFHSSHLNCLFSIRRWQRIFNEIINH